MSKFVKMDVKYLDYVIVHELCHFYEANHSNRFWYHVGLHYPEFKLQSNR